MTIKIIIVASIIVTAAVMTGLFLSRRPMSVRRYAFFCISSDLWSLSVTTWAIWLNWDQPLWFLIGFSILLAGLQIYTAYRSVILVRRFAARLELQREAQLLIETIAQLERRKREFFEQEDAQHH